MKMFLKIVLAVTVLVSACGEKESDPPVISSLSLVQDSVMSQQGAVLEVVYSISDDNGLSKFRLTILDDFPDARLALAPWFYERDFDVSGTDFSDTVVVSLPFPDVEPGQYKLSFTVADIDDNEKAQEKSFVIY
tara:strand:- start:151 stop:552 length:402 start_codon:yes stop_codon:yes gene_type:complete